MIAQVYKNLENDNIYRPRLRFRKLIAYNDRFWCCANSGLGKLRVSPKLLREILIERFEEYYLKDFVKNLFEMEDIEIFLK